jgi:hypothetical protein
MSRPRESRSLPVRARRRRSERYVKQITPLSEGNTAAWPKEEDWIGNSMGLCAKEYEKLRLRIDIVLLSGSVKHPCDMIDHEKAEDNMPGYPSSELRYLEMHQAVSFLLRQKPG